MSTVVEPRAAPADPALRALYDAVAYQKEGGILSVHQIDQCLDILWPDRSDPAILALYEAVQYMKKGGILSVYQIDQLLGLLEGESYLTSPYENAIIASGPIGYWRLGESVGSEALDSSGNNLHGTYINAPTLGAVGAIAGDAAVTLNGVDERIVVATHPLLNLGDILTLECWVKPVDFVAGQVLVDHGVGAYLVYLEAGTGFLNFHCSGSAALAHSNTPVVAGAWSHCVATKSGAVVHLYINGVDVTVVDAVATIQSNSTGLFMGCLRDITAFVKGSIDEVVIYNRALSASEALAHYNAGIG